LPRAFFVACHRGITVIPGREANPESRDSGFDATHRPGMTMRNDRWRQTHIALRYRV